MTKQEVVNQIIEDESFKKLCFRICLGNDIHQDLYQEFILQVLEGKDSELIKAADVGYLSVYCVGIINNLWNNRGRLKKYENGQTNSLAQLSNYFIEVSPKLTYSPDGTDLINKIKEELNNMMFSSNEDIRSDAYSLYKSIFVYKNIYQHALNTGVYDNKIRRQCKRAAEQIKGKL